MTRLPRPLLLLLVAVLTLATILTISYIYSRLSEQNSWEDLREPGNLSFSPDYRVFAADARLHGVSLWDTSRKKLIRKLGEGSLATQLVFAPDGDTFIWSNQEYAFFYSLPSEMMVSTPIKAEGWIYAIAISPARSVFSYTDILATGGRVSKDGKSAVELWNRFHAEDHAHYTVAEFQNDADVFSLAFSGDGKLLTAGLSDGTVYAWQISNSKLQNEFQATEVLTATPSHQSIDAIVISPDNQMIATGGRNGGISLLSTRDGEIIRQLSTEPETRLLAFSPDSKLLAVGKSSRELPDNSTASVWRVSDGVQQWKSKPHSAWIADLRFSSNGKAITIGYFDGTLETHNLP
jgi:WD40 repeat protein